MLEDVRTAHPADDLVGGVCMSRDRRTKLTPALAERACAPEVCALVGHQLHPGHLQSGVDALVAGLTVERLLDVASEHVWLYGAEARQLGAAAAQGISVPDYDLRMAEMMRAVWLRIVDAVLDEVSW
jgi:hypothetical protein